MLRRARRRRAANASAAALVAIGLATGLALGARELVSLARVTPADGGASPSPAVQSPTTTEPLPIPVLQTRDAILAAIEAGDLDAVERLTDPDRFSYNFGDGSNPVPEWRRDPAPLEPLPKILRMPFATRQGTPEVETIYLWPALTEADLAEPDANERAMLQELGISEREVQRMLEALGGYVDPRTGIAQDGTWLFYTTGGD